MRRYLKDGKEVVLEREVTDGYLVQDVFQAIDDDMNMHTWVDSKIYFVEELYNDPPKKIYHEEVQSLLDQIEKLKKTKEKLGKSIHNLRGKQSKLQNGFATASRKKLHINFS